MGRKNFDTRDLIILLFLCIITIPPPCLSFSLVFVCQPLSSLTPFFLYPLRFVYCLSSSFCRLARCHQAYLRDYSVKELLPKMSMAGPLTRSVSKCVKPVEAPAGNKNYPDDVQAPSNAQSPQPHGGLGRRLHSDEIGIGLALGSPRQYPLPALPPDDRDAVVDDSYVCNSLGNPASTLENKCEISGGSKGIKRKGSKWKSLGSFFGRREVRSASPFYQLDQKQQPEPAKQLLTQDYLETNARRRKRADSNHGHKAHQVESSMGRPGQESSGLLRRNSSRRRGLRREKLEQLQPAMQRIPSKYRANTIAGNLDLRGEQQGSLMPGPSLLQIEIPCVKLERYSVMFGDVLEPQVRQSKPQPSLLARRQVHLEELHTVADSSSEVRCSAI